MIAIWLGIAIGVAGLGVVLVMVWRARRPAVELGSMSDQWVGEQKMNDRSSYDR